MRGTLKGFPHGLPGLGLLILRVLAALLILFPGWWNLSGTDAQLSVRVLKMGAVMLLVGFLTPLAAAFCGTLLLLRVHVDPVAGSIGPIFMGALALLGAGAYSLDYRIFGAKRVVFRLGEDEDRLR